MSRKAKLRFDPIAEARRQWQTHHWESSEAMAFATSIMRAQQVILARVDAVLRPMGLTFARYEALTLLYLSRTGALPLGKMGVRLMVHPTSVTNTIDRLEEQGLVRRVAQAEDRRLTLASITPQGRRIVQKATRALGAMRFGAEPLSDREARDLSRILRRLREGAGDFDPSAKGAWSQPSKR